MVVFVVQLYVEAKLRHACCGLVGTVGLSKKTTLNSCGALYLESIGAPGLLQHLWRSISARLRGDTPARLMTLATCKPVRVVGMGVGPTSTIRICGEARRGRLATSSRLGPLANAGAFLEPFSDGRVG